jgi:GntP family gluconate:H+ symporter
MGTLTALALAILFIIVATARFGIHAYLALLLAALGFGIAAGLDPAQTVAAANEGFGRTIGNIGAVVILGGVIGIFLEKSGGALRIAEAVLKRTGEKNIPAAMAGVGYLVSIPVFCDTGFVILSALNRALSKRAGVTLASGAVALALGLYATHTMVPPTPGPVAAAGILGADLGTVILIGALIAALALIPGWLFAVTVAGRVASDPNAVAETAGVRTAGLAAAVHAPAPSTAHATIPILLPLALIVLGSIAALPTKPFGSGAAAATIAFLGLPTVSLLLGAAIALTLPRPFTLHLLSQESWVGTLIQGGAAGLLVWIASLLLL